MIQRDQGTTVGNVLDRVRGFVWKVMSGRQRSNASDSKTGHARESQSSVGCYNLTDML